MNIDFVFKKIVEKLQELERVDLISDLNDCTAMGSTGSEILSRTGAYLSRLQNVEPPVYKLLEPQIIDYLRYCKEHGLYPY